MKTRIFHGVNNALYFWHGDRAVIVDGVHQGHRDGFSRMPPALVEDLLAHRGPFRRPELLLFTHLHTDHYDGALLSQVLESVPAPLVYGPGLTRSSLEPQPLGGGLYRIPFGGGTVYAQDTVHEGEVFRGDPHQTFLVELDGERFFLAGDAILRKEDGARLRALAGGPVTAAFLNVYQLWEPGGAEFLRTLTPGRVFLNHMPFPEDDLGNLYGLARQVIRRFPRDLPRPVLLNPLTWVGRS